MRLKSWQKAMHMAGQHEKTSHVHESKSNQDIGGSGAEVLLFLQIMMNAVSSWD